MKLPGSGHFSSQMHRHGVIPAGNIRVSAASHETGRPESKPASGRPGEAAIGAILSACAHFFDTLNFCPWRTTCCYGLRRSMCGQFSSVAALP
jgi:hypothetical protein